MEPESALKQQGNPPSRNADRPNRVRHVTGWVMYVVAALLTVLAAVAAYDASTETSYADLGWFLAAIVGLAALAAWVTAIILVRTTGWVMYVVAAAFVLLTATALYVGLVA
jgi:hypothetical protein